MATQFGNNNSGNIALDAISYGSTSNFGNFVTPSVSSTLARTQYLSATQAVLGNGTAIRAAVADNGATQTLTTAITQPNYARNLTVLPSGTAGNVTAVTVIINGTDMQNQPISESFLLTAGALTQTVGKRAFKTVTSIVQPAVGSGVSLAYGTGNVIGMAGYLYGNTVLFAFLAGVKETTAPTVTTSTTSLSNNTFTLNSSLNGTPIYISYELAVDQSLVG